MLYATEEQKKDIPPMAKGEEIWCQCLVSLELVLI